MQRRALGHQCNWVLFQFPIPGALLMPVFHTSLALECSLEHAEMNCDTIISLFCYTLLPECISQHLISHNTLWIFYACKFMGILWVQSVLIVMQKATDIISPLNQMKYLLKEQSSNQGQQRVFTDQKIMIPSANASIGNTGVTTPPELAHCAMPASQCSRAQTYLNLDPGYFYVQHFLACIAKTLLQLMICSVEVGMTLRLRLPHAKAARQQTMQAQTTLTFN